jgi:hypothetical protein
MMNCFNGVSRSTAGDDVVKLNIVDVDDADCWERRSNDSDDDDDDDDDKLPKTPSTPDIDTVDVDRFYHRQKKGFIDVWWLFDDGGECFAILTSRRDDAQTTGEHSWKMMKSRVSADSGRCSLFC